MDTPSEVVPVGTTEVWEIHNYTDDAHPVHLHLVQFRVINREDMKTHVVTQPEPWETGFKDTVLAYPGGITRIQATYDQAGRYVWHCHILEHEDNEMMRPLLVLAPGQSADGFTIYMPSVKS
jgi:bilirubin oxidase